jgi:hypothetical protein
MTSAQAQDDCSIVSELPPCTDTRIGKLHHPVLLDLGSARSLNMFKHFKLLGL